VCQKRSNDMHARQSVAYKQINKKRIMKRIYSNTYIQWSLFIPIFLKINLVRLRISLKIFKYSYYHNVRKYR
jgi:hypothetical protein